MRSAASPELASIGLSPSRPEKGSPAFTRSSALLRSIEELREKLESGEIEKHTGRMARLWQAGHYRNARHAAVPRHTTSLPLKNFSSPNAVSVGPKQSGDYRRRVDVIEELAFIWLRQATFGTLIAETEPRYGEGTPPLSATTDAASYALSSGVTLPRFTATQKNWGRLLYSAPAARAHLRKLAAVTGGPAALKSKGPFLTEEALYTEFSRCRSSSPNSREGYRRG